MEKLLKISEVAERTSLSRTTVYELIGRGEIATVKIGAARRVPERALDRWIADKYVASDAA